MIQISDILKRTNTLVLQEYGFTGRGIKVAILDTGIDSENEIFDNTAITDYQLAEGSIKDKVYGHGTHLASILVSIAPDVEILNIKILDDEGNSQISTLMEGIELAYNEGADIINLSIGELYYGCPDDHPLSFLIKKIAESGVFIVCAAGNLGRTTPHIPASCNETIAVGSVNEMGKKNDFSSHGPVCGEKYPDCMAYGSNILAWLPNNEEGVLSGTSQAAIQVSGMFALVKQATGLRFNAKLIQYLLSVSCKPVESNEKTNSYGWGIIDMYNFYKAVEIYNNGLNGNI